MTPTRTTLPILSVLFLLAGTAAASEILPVKNDTNGVMTLWVYPYTVKNWRRPPERFAPSERRAVNFNSGEDYYLTFKDDQGDETPIGRYNITKVLQQNPTYELSIGRVVITTIVTEKRTRTFWCPRHRTWHEIPYAVCRLVAEERYVIRWTTRQPNSK